MPLHVSSTCAHHQEVKIALHSLWYHHTYRCDDTSGCVLQFWPPDDEHMCSKHVEAWNKLIVKQKCCAPSWLITEINKIDERIRLNFLCSKTPRGRHIGAEICWSLILLMHCILLRAFIGWYIDNENYENMRRLNNIQMWVPFTHLTCEVN